MLARRMPFQADPALRKRINAGEVMFVDQHLSETVEMLRSRQLGPVDVAIVEAVAIKEDGSIIPTTSVGNSATFAMLAEKVIVEINMTLGCEMEGLHDIYIPTRRPFRGPIPITNPRDRVGSGPSPSTHHALLPLSSRPRKIVAPLFFRRMPKLRPSQGI